MILCNVASLKVEALNQACQTQTASRAANETKTAERDAKLKKKILTGPHFKNLVLENDLILFYNFFSILKTIF